MGMRELAMTDPYAVVSVRTGHSHPTPPGRRRRQRNFTVSNAAISMQPVESSQIHSIGHDASTNTLAIRFKNTKGQPSSLYHYKNFTAEDFALFRLAKSIGSHFGKYIKNETVKHPFCKINETMEQAA